MKEILTRPRETYISTSTRASCSFLHLHIKAQLISLTRLHIFKSHRSIANIKGGGKLMLNTTEKTRISARRLDVIPECSANFNKRIPKSDYGSLLWTKKIASGYTVWHFPQQVFRCHDSLFDEQCPYFKKLR
jgi:hypothetical protein